MTWRLNVFFNSPLNKKLVGFTTESFCVTVPYIILEILFAEFSLTIYKVLFHLKWDLLHKS